MGRALTAIGIALKLTQIIGAAFGVSLLSGTLMTLVTTCFMVGGLAVIASENLNVTGALALISLVGIIGGIIPGENAVFLFAFMAVSLLSFAAMLISMKRKNRIIPGVGVILLTGLLALHTFGVFSLPTVAVTAVLILIYVSMGAGLYV